MVVCLFFLLNFNAADDIFLKNFQKEFLNKGKIFFL